MRRLKTNIVPILYTFFLFIIGSLFIPKELTHTQYIREPIKEVVIEDTVKQVKSRVLPVSAPIPSDNAISIINMYRAERGLRPYAFNSALSVSAQKRAKYLVENNQWSHDGFGEQFNGVGFYVGAENLAMGYESDEAVVRSWVASPPHAEFLFSSAYRSAGIGRYGNIVVLWMWSK